MRYSFCIKVENYIFYRYAGENSFQKLVQSRSNQWEGGNCWHNQHKGNPDTIRDRSQFRGHIKNNTYCKQAIDDRYN